MELFGRFGALVVVRSLMPKYDVGYNCM